jgi:hypothetical protein
MILFVNSFEFDHQIDIVLEVERDNLVNAGNTAIYLGFFTVLIKIHTHSQRGPRRYANGFVSLRPFD